MKLLSITELAGEIRDVPGDPYVMPANISDADRALWEATEADNERCAKLFPARLAQWHREREAFLAALKPAGPEPLFSGQRFVALDTIEHAIHQAFGSLRQADEDDEDKQACSERFNKRVRNHPKQALRYFTERAKALGEDQSEIVAILKIRKIIKGNAA